LASGLFPGGSALYAGLTAAQLGARVQLVTSFGPDFIGRDLLDRAGIEVALTPAAKTTLFEETYADGRRWARVLAKAEPLIQPVPASDIVFACPVISELASLALKPPPGTLVGVGLQGWLRRLGREGVVETFIPSDVTFVPAGAIAFCSSEDLGDQGEGLISKLRQRASVLVVTEGARGAVLYESGRAHRVLAVPAEEVDPTGAGDVFAACFLLAVASGKSPLEAGVAGACGAALAIGAPGPTALPDMRRLSERVDWYRSHVPEPAPLPNP
jgi:hypothetical protein